MSNLQVSTDKNIKSIRNALIEPSNDFLWTIKFNMPLEGKTVSNQTMSIKDEYGKSIKCNISYSTKTSSVIIKPLEAYKDDTRYFLSISKNVKSKAGKSFSDIVTVRFLLKNKVISEIEILRGNSRSEVSRRNLEIKHPAKENMKYIKLLTWAWLKYFFIISWTVIMTAILIFFVIPDPSIFIVFGIGAVLGAVFLFGYYQYMKNDYIRINKVATIYNKGVDAFNEGNYMLALDFFENARNQGDVNFVFEGEIKKTKKYL